jgi:hypothetical protein
VHCVGLLYNGQSNIKKPNMGRTLLEMKLENYNIMHSVHYLLNYLIITNQTHSMSIEVYI